MQNIKLSSNYMMPQVGLGTYGLDSESQIYDAIMNGYTHIDCASFYKNEEIIGNALQKCFKNGIKREDLFIVSKIFPSQLDMEYAIKESLQKLQIDYLDLYLIHWPITVQETSQGYQIVKMPLHKKWHQMEQFVENNLTKSIGVSNFSIQLLLDLLSYCKISPAVNQIEINPTFPQNELKKFLYDFNIAPVAFYPLCKKTQQQQFTDEIIQDLKTKYLKTEAQILLRWGIQKGHSVIPKSSQLQRQKENLNIFDFEISDNDMDKLDQMQGKLRQASAYPFTLGYNMFV